ncbi:MAG: hypothetical protein NTY77_10310 [Elusimicrobia bacterium]|nr:hypothetical protein [Elusimicrobiota bacterium]
MSLVNKRWVQRAAWHSSVCLPPQWLPKDEGLKGHVLFVIGKDAPDPYFGFSINGHELKTPYYSSQAFKNLWAGGEGNHTELKSVKIGGLDGYQRVTTIPADRGHWAEMSLQTYLQAREGFYEIVGSCPPERFKELQPIFEKAVASFRSSLTPTASEAAAGGADRTGKTEPQPAVTGQGVVPLLR